MKKIIAIFGLFVIFCEFSNGQMNKSTSPMLLGIVGTKSEDVGEIIKLVSEKFINSDGFQQASFAIRVCSKDTLSVALANAKGLPFTTAQYLESKGVPNSKIFYLRNDKNCAESGNNYLETEYWFIPKGSEFPQFIELKKASNLNSLLFIRHTFGNDSGKQIALFDAFGGDETILTEQSYDFMLNDLTNMLKSDNTAIIIIENVVSGKSLSPLNKKVVIIKNTLMKQGISNYRIFVKNISSGISNEFPQVWVIGEN